MTARSPSPGTPLWMALLLIGSLAGAPRLRAAELVIYGFEGGLEGWAIPEWAKSSPDYVAEECRVSQEHMDEGRHALELRTRFPGQRWAGAYVERQVEVTDWSPFSRMMVDVYLPTHAPEGLRAKAILTVGPQWQWTEMNRSIPLRAGAWTTITVNLKPGSLDWKFFPTEGFRKDIRKMGFRVESDKGAPYHGSVFLDNVRLAE